MTIFSVRETTLLLIYKCPICGLIFRRQTGDVIVRCAVNHAPGTCCHYGETQINESKIIEILEVIERKE